MNTEVIDSWTCTKKENSQLLVMFARNTAGGGDQQYQQEGHRVARWLIGVFCDRTLSFIHAELTEFMKKGCKRD